MSATQSTAVRLAPIPAASASVERSRPDLRRFALIILPLALVLAVFKVYKVEQPAFFDLACLVFGGFAVSYWLPFRYKQPFQIVLSLAGAYVLLAPLAASLLIGAGLFFFAVIRSGLAFRLKVGVLLAVAVALAWCRMVGMLPVPSQFWPVFGAIFMFRMIVYLYDLKHSRRPASLQEFLAYFFLLPNYYFLLFPVIDFQTFRSTYFKRDIHETAQKGAWWIIRGLTHLLAYRLLYQLQVNVSPTRVPVPVAVIGKMALCYLLYVRVSGQFHIATGMLCLFGYDLPETNRLYLLSNGLSDYWRRINIYWKDFMVKVFYFPVYFKLRRTGEMRAKLLATMAVFAASWFLHGYQFFWLQNRFRASLTDSIYWSVLGCVVLIDVVRQDSRPKPARQTGWRSHARNAAGIALTFAFTAVLWSLWSADGLTEWVEFLKTGTL